jgi:hypothetical protein
MLDLLDNDASFSLFEIIEELGVNIQLSLLSGSYSKNGNTIYAENNIIKLPLDKFQYDATKGGWVWQYGSIEFLLIPNEEEDDI